MADFPRKAATSRKSAPDSAIVKSVRKLHREHSDSAAEIKDLKNEIAKLNTRNHAQNARIDLLRAQLAESRAKKLKAKS